MKKNLFYTVLVTIAFISFFPFTSRADLGSGDLYYQWIADSTYAIYFKGYYSCGGLPEPSTQTLCITNSCNSSVLSLTMNKTTVTTVGTTCPAYPDKCSSASSSIPGYKAVTYYISYTLPFRCNFWKMAITATRNGCINLSSGAFYTEATFDNTGSKQGNSSPYFSNLPVSIIYSGVPKSYNAGAIDPNSDSLSTDIVNVRDGNGCSTAPTNSTFSTTSPALSIPSNPFQTNITTTCSATSGFVSFTPAVTGENVMAIRVREYRNGSLIGSVMRELRFSVVSGTPTTISNTPPFALSNCTLVSSSIVQGCAGQTIGFSIDVKSPDPTAVLSVSDNHSTNIPAATINYSTQAKDSIRINFSWAMPATASGIKYIIFTVQDSSCKAPGIITYTSFMVTVQTVSKPYVGADTNLCTGQTVTLSGANTWSILSGSPGSLSCTSCSNPIASPTVTSQYIGTSTTCPSLSDTITVTIAPTTTPAISIAASPGTSITAGTNVTFTATVTNCTSPSYQWKKNAVSIPFTGNSYVSNTLANGDMIACQLTCNDKCPNPKVQASNTLTMNVTPLPGGINSIENNTAFMIIPNPNNGKFNLLFTDKRIDNTPFEITNVFGQIVYTGNTSQKEIDTHNMPSGLYLLRIKLDGVMNTQRFSIEK
ncbi:MAG: T9SS type A sorting domain-containing protein [Bacteroidetes bacterium]|nr:T9SS type A sorting domain-containing protein [Bacteroidota bacterium]